VSTISFVLNSLVTNLFDFISIKMVYFWTSLFLYRNSGKAQHRQARNLTIKGYRNNNSHSSLSV